MLSFQPEVDWTSLLTPEYRLIFSKLLIGNVFAQILWFLAVPAVLSTLSTFLTNSWAILVFHSLTIVSFPPSHSIFLQRCFLLLIYGIDPLSHWKLSWLPCSRIHIFTPETYLPAWTACCSTSGFVLSSYFSLLTSFSSNFYFLFPTHE